MKITLNGFVPQYEKGLEEFSPFHNFDDYKPIGWEVIDIRHGGVAARLETAIARVDDYLSGRIECIEELEEARLSFSGTGAIRQSLEYLQLCSASNLGRIGF